jgi:TRAP-type C4-dicarboxylate transport system substrate-binding protein
MKNLFKTLTAVLALGTGLVAWAGTPTPVSAQTKILVHIFAPPNYPNNSHGWDYLKENIERDTQGRVIFEYTPGKVAPPQKNWDNVVTGIVDAAYLHTGFERKRLLLNEVGRLPGHTPTATAMAVASWRTHKKFFEEKDEFKGVKLLSLYTFPGENIWTIHKPINTLDDLKGMKLRSGAGLAANIFTALGIAPVPSLAAEVFPMVSKGVVDGMTGPAAFVTVVKVDQFIKYGIRYPGAFNTLMWTPILRKEKWESISADDQAIMEKYFGEPLARSVAGEWDRRNVESLKQMAAAGVQIHEASPEFVADVQKKTAVFTDEWLVRAAQRGVDGKAALAYYKEQLDELK